MAAVLAMRARYKIANPCDPDAFRPLQPHGSWKKTEHHDEDLLGSLGTIKDSLVASDPVNESHAGEVATAFAKLDVYSVQLGFPLNRWTEDGFNGNEHVSTDEWIPEIAMEGQDETGASGYHKAQNAYLEKPSDENFWAMYDLVGTLSGKRFGDGGVGERLSREKYRSVLLLTHMMRKGAYEFPSLEKQKDFMKFSVWETGQVATVMLQGCAEADLKETLFPCWGFPKKFFEKMGTDREKLLRDVGSISLPWLTAGIFLDPSFQFTELGDAQIEHWHDALSLRAQTEANYKLPFHHFIVAGIKLFKAMDAMDEKQPSGHSFEHQTVNGCWNSAHPALSQWSTNSLKVLDEEAKKLDGGTKSTFVGAVTNFNRVVLYSIEHAVKAPKEQCKEHLDKNKLKAIVASLGEWGKGGATPAPNQALSDQVQKEIGE